MKIQTTILTLFLLLFSFPATATDGGKKEEAVASIEKHKAELIKLSDQIWAFAETALREHFIVEFKGRAAHAAYDPWNGRSAVDGLEAFTHGINLLREHVRPTVRMHYTIVKGGDVPNVVPEYAKVWCWVRDTKRDGADAVLQRAREIAQGAALIAGVEATFTVQTGSYELLVNNVGAKLLHRNLTWLGPIKYSEAEQEFARAIQLATGVKEKGLSGEIKPLKIPHPDPPAGSTDVGDVSWITRRCT